MIKEFREFAMRGNVIDLAIGLVMGVAFGDIVNSLVNDIIMPPIGLVLNGVNFSDLFVDLSGVGYASLAAAQEAGAPTINYGLFLNTVIKFFLVAFAMFLLVKSINAIHRKKEQEEAEKIDEPDAQERLIEAMNRLADELQKK